MRPFVPACILVFVTAVAGSADDGAAGALASQQRPLKVVVCPAHDIDHVQREYLLFVNHLQRELGRRVRLFGLQRYARLTGLLRRDGADMGIVSLSALDEVERRGMRDRIRIVAAQVLNNRERYRGVVVTRPNGGMTAMDDLAGKTLVIPDYRSYGGWRTLQSWFDSRGVTANRFFGAIEQAGGHVEALQVLLDGGADAAAVSSLALDHAQAQGLDVQSCVPIYKSNQIPFDGFFVSARLPEDFIRKVVVAVLAFKARTPIGGIVMEWRRATDASYVP